MQSLMKCNLALNFWYGGKPVSQGYIGAKALFEIFLIFDSTTYVIADAATKTNDLAKGSDTLSSIFGVSDRRTSIAPDDPTGYKPDKITGHIDLCNIEFAYPARPNMMIFNRFSINIAMGKSTALVGQSGLRKINHHRID